VTRAATLLNLTQSAVSMQLKRLEENLGLSLLDRSERTIRPTSEGEQLLGYARKMLDLNDEALGRLTADSYEGEITLGVPHDIVYPVLPPVLRQFSMDFPRMQVRLISSYTKQMKEQFERHEIDVLLTTEYGTPEDATLLRSVPLVWIGAPEGTAYRNRPLRLAHEAHCIFRQIAQRSLDEANLPWQMALDTDSTRTAEATVAADLAIHTMLKGTEPPQLAEIDHNGALPDLPVTNINLYIQKGRNSPVIPSLADLLTKAYSVTA
jgi:DNA-binding transcriptional LysR family regulator